MQIFPSDQPFMFGEVHYRNGGHFGPVSGSHLDLIVLHEGELLVSVDGVMRNLSGGQAGVFFSERSVDYMLFGNCHYTWCETGELPISDSVRASLQKLPAAWPIWDRLVQLHALGVQLGPGAGDHYVKLLNSLGAASFYEFFHRVALPDIARILPPAVQRAKRHIERHYDSSCTLRDIAQYAGLTPNYLVTNFRRHMGLTPSRYLWQVRTEHGLELITQTDLGIAQIAARCGFQNQFHFSRHIKKLFGASPSDLRRRNWRRQPSIVKGEPVNVAYASAAVREPHPDLAAHS